MVPHQEAVQGPEVMQEAHEEAQDHGGQAEKAEEGRGGHMGQPQVLKHRQGEESDRYDLDGDEHQHPDAPGEDAAFSGLAVPEVGHRDPMEIVEAVAQWVVTKVSFVVTVRPKVPLP